VDAGFPDTDLFVKSQDDHGVDLQGPTQLDYHGQSRDSAGFGVQHFQPDDGSNHYSQDL
jgi:hypothetical protein